MLLNSLIFLLLSNSITSRRDKSILYSRVAISILLLSTLITYDNLSILFLAKGIGISGGIPPLIGFFGKQMILSAAIDNGYIFMSLVAILTSVISAVYYLTIIKQVFFDKNDYRLNEELEGFQADGLIIQYYISEPRVFLNGKLKTSGFYTGKGKGKAIDSPTPPQSPTRSESPTESDFDSELERKIHRAKWLSMEQNKVGESSKTILDKESPPVQEDFYSKLINMTKDWKLYQDMYLKKAKLFNTLKIKLDKQNFISNEESALLSGYKNDCDNLKSKRSSLEKKLLEHGINPAEQFSNQPNSATESSSDQGSSYSYNSSNTHSTSNSNFRSNKRVKYSDEKNIDFNLNLFILNFVPWLRIVSFLFSAILLLLLDWNILPKINLIFIDLELAHIVFLCLIYNLTKLVYKWYIVIITLYKQYLNKDYMVIYFNIYFGIVIALLYLTTNSDIYILYI